MCAFVDDACGRSQSTGAARMTRTTLPLLSQHQHPTHLNQTPKQVYRFLGEIFTERGKASRNEADLRRAADAFEQAAEHLSKGPRAEKGADKVIVLSVVGGIWCGVCVCCGGDLRFRSLHSRACLRLHHCVPVIVMAMNTARARHRYVAAQRRAHLRDAG